MISAEDNISLREWAQLLVSGLDERMELRFHANDKAIQIASEALTIRMDHANGLIAQMKEQAEDFARKMEVDAVEKRVELLEQHRVGVESRHKGGQPLRDIGMLIVGAVVAYVATKLGG